MDIELSSSVPATLGAPANSDHGLQVAAVPGAPGVGIFADALRAQMLPGKATPDQVQAQPGFQDQPRIQEQPRVGDQPSLTTSDPPTLLTQNFPPAFPQTDDGNANGSLQSHLQAAPQATEQPGLPPVEKVQVRPQGSYRFSSELLPYSSYPVRESTGASDDAADAVSTQLPLTATPSAPPLLAKQPPALKEASTDTVILSSDASSVLAEVMADQAPTTQDAHAASPQTAPIRLKGKEKESSPIGGGGHTTPQSRTGETSAKEAAKAPGSIAVVQKDMSAVQPAVVQSDLLAVSQPYTPVQDIQDDPHTLAAPVVAAMRRATAPSPLGVAKLAVQGTKDSEQSIQQNADPGGLTLPAGAEPAKVASPKDRSLEKVQVTEEPQAPGKAHELLQTSESAPFTGASFTLSMHMQGLVRSSGGDAPHATSAAATEVGRVPDDASMSQPASVPLHRLEVEVNDPVLGSVDVRAEMRGGLLHATLSNGQEDIAATMPALHQFLQQHQVQVQTLSFSSSSDSAFSTSPTPPEAGGFGRQAGDAAGGGGREGSQQQPSQSRPRMANDVARPLLQSATQTLSGLHLGDRLSPSGNSLSIHI